MITRKRKRSPGEEEVESDVSVAVIHPPLPQPEMITKNRKMSPGEEEEEESDEEALSYDEKVAMVILVKEFHWYSDVRDYMKKTFKWSKLGEDDELFLDAMIALGKPQDFLCDLMTSIEFHHKDFSNHKSLINDQRAKFYNYFFESSHKASDLALKEYFASFQPSSNSLPFPDSDSDSKEDKDGETSSQSENSNISSKTEPEMITRKRKRSPGEEEQESDGSGDIHHPLPPMIFEDEYLLSREDSFMYHDHSKCHLNYRCDDDDYDFDAELFGTEEA